MNLPNYLELHPKGEIRFVGSRIDLFDVMHLYHEGFTPEMVVLEFETVCLADVRKAFAYYEANRAEVDAYVDECKRQIAENRAKYGRLDVETLKARLAERERQANSSQAG